MGRIAGVTARRDGFVPMREMIGSLAIGDWTDVPDELVLHEAGWTLFTYDFDAAEAVFTDTGAADLSAVPFCYQAQYKTAKRLMRVPFASFTAMAESIPRTAPVLQVFNMGHCGSTLLHHVLNASGSVWCVSEPMFTFELAVRRDEIGQEMVRDLMRAGLAFLRLYPGADGRDRIAVKHFNQTTTIIAACHAAEPAPRHLFLYRGAEGWCNSLYGFVQRLGRTLDIAPDQRGFIWWIMSANTPLSRLEEVVDLSAEVLTFDRMAAAGWAVQVGAFRAAVADGVPMRAVRYEDLLADRTGVLTGAFAALGLDPAGVAPGLVAFDRDSHEGAATARSVPVLPLPPEAPGRIRAVLAHPSIGMTGNEVL